MTIFFAGAILKASFQKQIKWYIKNKTVGKPSKNKKDDTKTDFYEKSSKGSYSDFPVLDFPVLKSVY